MSDAVDDRGSGAKDDDPVTGNLEGLPDPFGEDPDHEEPLVGDQSVKPPEDD